MALPIPVYFMRSVGSTVAVFFWKTPTRPTWKWPGTISVKCTFVTSSRRCVQHAPCRRIVGEEMAPIRTRLLSGRDTHQDAIHEQAGSVNLKKKKKKILLDPAPMPTALLRLLRPQPKLWLLQLEQWYETARGGRVVPAQFFLMQLRCGSTLPAMIGTTLELLLLCTHTLSVPSGVDGYWLCRCPGHRFSGTAVTQTCATIPRATCVTPPGGSRYWCGGELCRPGRPANAARQEVDSVDIRVKFL